MYLCRMNTNDNKIRNYSEILDQKYGADGTEERMVFEQNAYDFYSGMVLHQARKEAKITQSELAHRTGTSKSYISRIENGTISPSVGVFYRMISALGMRIEIVKPIA
jgi:DNA-binding XRE family transcriptional regulator